MIFVKSPAISSLNINADNDSSLVIVLYLLRLGVEGYWNKLLKNV